MEKITSRKNPLAVHFKKLGVSRSYREKSGEFLCDGMKLLEDAISSGAAITAILTAKPIQFPLSLETRVYYANRDLIDSLSPLKNAQDVLFSCKMREQDSCQWTDIGGTHLLLDNVQDPGNVGAVIRTANAFSVNNVILFGGCADAYNPKTLRASMGAVFRQYICKMDISDLTAKKDGGFRFIGAALRKDCRAVFDVKLDGAIIAIGNEGLGLSAEILSLCDELITIPINPGCESLNAAVAAAIIMWESQRSCVKERETLFVGEK